MLHVMLHKYMLYNMHLKLENLILIYLTTEQNNTFKKENKFDDILSSFAAAYRVRTHTYNDYIIVPQF